MKMGWLHVQLASQEWGNEAMDIAAKAAAEQHRTNWPVVVHVYEHAGWFLSYFFSQHHSAGLVVASANDSAQWREEQQIARNLICQAEFDYLPSVNRNTADAAMAA